MDQQDTTSSSLTTSCTSALLHVGCRQGHGYQYIVNKSGRRDVLNKNISFCSSVHLCVIAVEDLHSLLYSY